MSIRFNNVSYRYQPGTPHETAALSAITLEIATGCCFGVSGRTGAGKSTLVQLLSGLLKPACGCITIDRTDGTAQTEIEMPGHVGIVFQYPEQQLFGENVYAEIAFGVSRQGMSAAETERRVWDALKLVGLGGELLEQSPFRLSGGQKRRVAIAGVLAMQPDVLILDEPAAGLDPQGRREIMAMIAQMQKKLGFTLLLVSNYLDDIVRIADRMVILNNGSIALEGTPREVLTKSAALEAAGMVLPQITDFMKKLRKQIPELAECVLTVEEARDELLRVMPHLAEGEAPLW